MLRAEIRTPLRGFDLDVDLVVEPGRCLALTGPSGAGKTSVLRTVAGLLRPARGRVACGDEVWLDVARRHDVAPEARRCGYVFQDYALFGHLSARDNVAYGLRDLPRRQRRRVAVEWLERFGVGELGSAPPAALSGGERQRVALARALARRPAVLLLDEPLSALDPRTRAHAGRELGAVLREAGVPTLLVTHDYLEAATLADRVGVLDAGRVVQDGTAAELAARPATALVADLTGAVVLTGTARRASGGLTAVSLDGGGELHSVEPASGRVAVSVFPWEITLHAPGAHEGSARNHVDAEVVSVARVGSRVRVGLQAGQPFVAEVTEPAVADLGLQPGTRVTASFKAAGTRILALE